MRTFEYHIDNINDGNEVGRLLKSFGYSRAAIVGLKHSEGLLLNGKIIRTVDTVHTGDRLTVRFSESSDAVPNEALKADILFDDDDIVVFNKPAGMPVHRSNGHNNDTLENLFAALFPETAFHAVSRLDRNTSGIVIVAKNKYSAARLMSVTDFRAEKVYYAVTATGFCEKYGMTGEINAPIARENESIIKRTVRSDGDRAVTKYKVLKNDETLTFLEISLITGRTHQIRVHFSYLGFPLLGDELYGGDMTFIKRQALHCSKVSFIHPVTKEQIALTATIPEDISGLLKKTDIY